MEDADKDRIGRTVVGVGLTMKINEDWRTITILILGYLGKWNRIEN